MARKKRSRIEEGKEVEKYEPSAEVQAALAKNKANRKVTHQRHRLK